MAARPEPLVRELPRQRGQHDSRWVHLLGDVPSSDGGTAEAAPSVDRESVLAAGGAARDERVRASYDAVAAAYADALADELGRLPFETWLLGRVAAHAGGGPVVEVGSGPGHVTAHLAEAGADAIGVDLSPGMLAVARERLPEATFVEADATSLPLPDASVDVVICVTGLHLFPDPAAAIAEWARVLRPEGRAVTATFGRMDPAEHGGRHGAPQPPSYPTHHELFETPELLAAAVAPAGFSLARHAWWTSGGDRILLAELTR